MWGKFFGAFKTGRAVLHSGDTIRSMPRVKGMNVLECYLRDGPMIEQIKDKWWRCRDLNPGRRGYEPRALTS